MPRIHEKEIIVTENHLDHLNHVNNVQYIFWVEEMAKEHWDILKHETPFVKDYWVLADHFIQYKKQVFKGDVITVKTYPQKPEGIRQPRKVEFYRGEELVVDSTTHWILMNAESHKMIRLPEDWLKFE